MVANITDVDWNLDEVIVDLAPIGGGLVEMNDRGLDGDQSVGDDIFSTVISVPGLEIETLTTLPLAITGFNEASLPIRNDTFGCRE